MEIVELREEDRHWVGEALLRTARWRESEPTLTLEEQVIALPRLTVYFEGWGRDGDLAFAARQGEATMGVVWYRLFQADSAGYGFVDEDTPELGIAVWPKFRRQGVGASLMRAVLEQAAPRFSRLSLSVGEHNLAARALYASAGFMELTQEGLAIKMVSPDLSNKR